MPGKSPKYRSHLHLLVCDRNSVHGDYLQRAAKQLQAENISVSTQQSWRDNFHETIIQAQRARLPPGGQAALPENPLKRALLTPDDWKLLRYSPVPVLIVKSSQIWSQDGTILAAVDVGNSGSEHKALHASLIRNALAAAEITGARVHVFSAYPAPMLSAADPTFQLRETIEARYRTECQKFVEEFGLDPANMHLKEGPADVLIPRMANALGAVLTVVGTVARTGLSGALIGNTAEVVLDALETDVLVVKPKNVMDYLENQLQK